MKIKIIIPILLMFFFSCKEETKETTVKDDLFGQYFNLDKDNIDVYLPNTLQQYTVDQYAGLLGAIEDSVARQTEIMRFNILKYSKKNVYFFRTLNHTTDVSIKMTDYFPFSKEDSRYMSALVSQSCQESASVSNSTCTKLKSGYSGNKQTQAFMAKYKIESGTEPTSYATIYAVSSNYKSFIITFRSMLNRKYNTFIQKTIVK